MNVERVRHRLSEKGPHILRTSDGREYPVPHPEFVLVGRRNIVVEEENGFINIIDPLHVVAIRKGPATKGKNGSSGKAH
jgi:hypothetical protein